MAESILDNNQTFSYPSEETIQEFARRSKLVAQNKAILNLKRGLWIYFWLLIYEGALRKWIVPGLATPLLVIRDPIVIWLIVYGYMQNIMKGNNFIAASWITGLICLLTTLLLGHGDLGIAIFGLRILVLHLPFIFLIGSVFDKDDVIRIGKALLWSTILMTIIIGIQFYSPQTAWINVGVGGTGSSGFSGTKDYFRPSGVFSFTNGVSNFYGIVGAFICFFWVDNTPKISKLLLIVSSIALVAAIPLSISRTVFFQMGLSIAFTFFLTSQKPKLLGRMITAVIASLAIFFLLSKASFFKTGTEAFTDRFETANKVEGGAQNVLIDRILGGMAGAISNSDEMPFFGYGLGMGTNVGAQLLTGKAAFLFNSEGEWGRLIGEMGIILGLLFIIIRVGIAFSFLGKAFKEIKRSNYLPWLLSSFAFLTVLQGQWGQPTSLGFAVFSGGLVFAAFNKPKASTNK